MENNKYSRREFVSKYIYGGTFFMGGVLIFGCSSMQTAAKENPKPVPPNDAEPLPQDVPAQVAQDTSKTASQQIPKSAETASAKNPCDDLTGVSPEEIEKRKKLAYVDKSPIPDNYCTNCVLYIPPKEGKPCGGCLLFKGPVRAEGYCAYWAPINN